MPNGNTTTAVAQFFKMVEQSYGCTGDKLLAPYAWKEGAADKDGRTTTG